MASHPPSACLTLDRANRPPGETNFAGKRSTLLERHSPPGGGSGPQTNSQKLLPLTRQARAGTNRYKPFADPAVRFAQTQRNPHLRHLSMNSSSLPQPSAAAFGAVVGWDWSDQKHDLYLRLPAQPQGQHESIANTPEALHAWFQSIPQRFGPHRILIAIEASRSALLPIFLQYRDWIDVFWLNPRTLAKYRQALKPSGAKSDRLDCELAADLAASHPEQLHRWAPADLNTAQLAIEVQQRRQLIDQRTQTANRLKAHLKTYFPQALDWLDDDLTTAFAIRFLSRWQTLQSLQASPADALRRFWVAHRRRPTEGFVQRLNALASRVAVTHAPAFLVPAVAYTQALVRQLAALEADLRGYDRRLKSLTRCHPSFPVVAQLPGAGPVLQARLLAALGADPLRYGSACDLAIVAGIAPVQKASGKTHLTLRRVACPHFLHQTFIEFAKNSIPWCRWAATYMTAKTEEGCGYFHAVRSLAFKWTRILHALMRSGASYDESVYEASLTQHGSPFALRRSAEA